MRLQFKEHQRLSAAQQTQGRSIKQILPPALGRDRPHLDLGCLVAQSCRLFATPWTVAHQAPLSMGFPRQEYWNGLPFPSPGDIPDPGIEPVDWHADSLPWSHQGPIP